MADPLRFAVDRCRGTGASSTRPADAAKGIRNARSNAVAHPIDDDEYAKTGKGWDELAAAFKEWRKSSGPCNSLVVAARDAPDWPWLRKAFQYDFVPFVECYGGSARYLFGENDTPTPVRRRCAPRGRIEEQSEPRLVRTDHFLMHAQLLRRPQWR